MEALRIAGVVPARAGVIPGRRSLRAGLRSRPRASGGHPSPGGVAFGHMESSPRERGSSSCCLARRFTMRVVPARAGVIRGPATGLTSMRCRPRASGGHPPGIVIPDGASASSPRERGSSPARQAVVARMGVVPARAGVIRATTRRRPRPTSRPRASGGHPANGGTGRAITKSSPRERGSSPPRGGSAGSGHVVPARAGVILPRGTPARRGRSRPRASGGHPRAATTGPANIMSSPRERGSSAAAGWVPRDSFVVPARAGVIRSRRHMGRVLGGRPRASGGHPFRRIPMSATSSSSPRERGSSGRGHRPGR